MLTDLTKGTRRSADLFQSLPGRSRHPRDLEPEEKLIILASRQPADRQIRTGSLQEVSKRAKSFGTGGGDSKRSTFVFDIEKKESEEGRDEVCQCNRPFLEAV